MRIFWFVYISLKSRDHTKAVANHAHVFIRAESAGPCASFISFNEMRAGAPLYQPIKHYNFGKVVKSASIKTGLLELSDFKTITILNIVPICFGVGSVISSNILLLFHSSTRAGVGE